MSGNKSNLERRMEVIGPRLRETLAAFSSGAIEDALALCDDSDEYECECVCKGHPSPGYKSWEEVPEDHRERVRFESWYRGEGREMSEADVQYCLNAINNPYCDCCTCYCY